MNFPAKQTGIFEKIIKDQSGNSVLIRFVVTEREGRFFGRIISSTPIAKIESGKKSSSSPEILCIACGSIDTAHQRITKTKVSAKSPYFNSLILLASQMPRAPSF